MSEFDTAPAAPEFERRAYVPLLDRAVTDAYADARAEIERAGRRIESVSARLEPDASLAVDATRVVFTFNTAPITSARDALQTSAERRAR